MGGGEGIQWPPGLDTAVSFYFFCQNVKMLFLDKMKQRLNEVQTQFTI